MRYEILDPKRIQRPGRGRRIEWRVSLRTAMEFRTLLEERVDLELEPWTQEVEERMRELEEEIRALPGFPERYHPDEDVIVPVTTSVQR